MPDFKTDKGEKAAKNGRRRVGLSDANSGRAKFAKDMQAEMTRDDRSTVQRYEQAIAPDRIVEPRCHVCQHPYRDFIETMLIKGHTYLSISKRVNPEVDRRSISNHYKNHMDLQDAALRSILEDEARLQGANFEEGVRDAITKRGVLEVALRKGFEDVLNGVTTVEPRDLIQIAKVLGDMDSQQHQVAVDELRAQVAIFIQAIKDVCSIEMQGQIGNRVKELRKRDGLAVEIEHAMRDRPQITEGDEEVVDAEVVA